MPNIKTQNQGINPSVKNSFNTISDKNNTDSKSSLDIIATPADDDIAETPPQSWLDQSPPFDYDSLPIPNDFDGYNLNPESNDGFSDPECEYSLDNSRTEQEEGTGSAVYKVTVINQRHLGDSIAKILELHRFLGVHSPYGTGKTTSIKKIIEILESEKKSNNSTPNILFVVPRTSLCIAISKDFDAICNYLDAKNKKDFTKAERLKMIDSMATCPQSLGALIDEARNDVYDLVIFDESESIAKLLVSTATKDKERTLYAMQRVVRASNKVVFMDADYGDVSKLFSELLTGIKNTHILKNSHKPWSDYTAKILTGGTFSDRKEALSSMIMQDIAKGENTALFSSSASFCTGLHEIVKGVHPELNSKLATSETDNQELMSDPKKIVDINNLFYSPSLSVGISFDTENHVNRVYSCLTNEKDTPDTHDAGQGNARLRKPKYKEWVHALDDDKQIYTGDPLIPEDISRAIMSRLMGNLKAMDSNFASTTDLTNQILELFALVEAKTRQNKNNYNKEYLAHLKELGMRIEYIDINDFFSDLNIKKTMKENKEKRAEQSIQNILNAPKISDEDNKKLSARRRLGQRLTVEEESTLERHYLETAFNVDFDKMNDGDKREVMTYKDDSFISKAVLRAQAGASTGFDKAYIAMGLNGVGDDEAGKRDILHKRHNYRLKKKLHAYALPYIDCEKEYSHKSLKLTGFYRYIIRNKKDINILMPNFIPSNFKAKPAGLMNKLLENQGYKHTGSQSGNKGDKKREYIYRAMLSAPFEKFYNEQELRGDNWVENTEKIFDKYESHKEVLSKQDIERLQIPLVDIRFITDKLAQIPKVQHVKIMNAYKDKYDIMKHGEGATEIANIWLENQAKKHSISEVEIA